ncbi:MAG: hypothetical protein N3B12_01730 [Armatimonadetes bacterium]|nr:hypothetical protein [Armatimonadota bacterium]
MAIRKILYILAVIVVLIGVSQLVFARWWLDRMPDLVHSGSFYLWGLPSVLFGVLLLIGIMERAVGLRLFMGIVSVISVIGGGTVLARPDSARRAIDWLLLDRSYGFQIFEIWLTGLIRMAIGVSLFWALIRPESPSIGPQEREVPAEPYEMEQ